MDNKNSKKTGGEQVIVSLTAEKQYQRGEHPNSQANLEPFEKGVSGNPSGRLTKYVKLKKALDKYGKYQKKDYTGELMEPYKERTLERVWIEASKGNIQHIKILAELGCLDDD